MITLKYKDELISKLRDKEYRQAFVRSHIRNGIAFQIRTMRSQKPWTQEKLAEQIGKQQTAISRLENPDYGHFTLKTLEELADVFDVALIVRFAPFSDLADWDLNLSSQSLERIVEFKDDPYFKEEPEEDNIDMQSSDDLKYVNNIYPFPIPKRTGINELLRSGQPETKKTAMGAN